LRRQIDDLQRQSQRFAGAKKWTDLASGITQVTMAAQSLGEIGRIFNDKDLSAGEKLTQITMNLAMGLPMLIKGLYSAGTAMKLIGTESEVAGIKMTIFGEALSVNPIFIWVTAATALITALGAIVKGIDEAREAAIRMN
jgi:hypothetical protein